MSRVALIHRNYTTSGGTERYLVGFSRWLVAQGHEVHVLCHAIRDDLRAEPGIRFHHLPMLRPGRALKVLSLQRSVQRALDRLSREIPGGFDAILGLGRHTGHHLMRAGGGSHAAFLRRCHPWRRWISPTDWIEAAMDRRALRSSRIVVANSLLCAGDIRADHPGVRVEVVYNGVDLRRFRPDPDQRLRVRREVGGADISQSQPIALFLGTGFHRKGLDTAIAALPPGWTLWVVGEGRPLPARGAQVRYLGPARAPERFLQAADALVLPTRYDPFANACLEAMACGIPALTTPTNGVAELLPEPWMIADTAQEFREALLRVEPSLGERCRAISEQYTPERSFSRLLDLLLEAARLPPPERP